jgi:hypothetical protein
MMRQGKDVKCFGMRRFFLIKDNKYIISAYNTGPKN